MSRDSGTGASTDVDKSPESEEKPSDKNGLTPQEVLNEILEKKEQLVREWYEQINKEPPKIDAFLDPANANKNRFKGVLLYDRSRVIIKDKKGSDYYHASYVDSYYKKNGYILAQAPFDDGTESDFWRMVMKQKPSLLVLLGSLVGADSTPRMKCFWPSLKQERQYAKGSVRVRCTEKDQESTHENFEFCLLGAGQRSKNAFKVQMLQNRKWIEDKEVPDNLLDFRAVLKIALHRSNCDGPIILLCPTGVHRCGTFAILNIVSDRLTDEKKVGLDETLAVVRAQRYGCVAHFGHYRILHDLIVHQAVAFGAVDPSAIGGRKR